jgi:hypothetical protein
MTLDAEFARLIDATPEEVFDAFTDPEGQEAFYGQDDPGWIVRSQCDLRVGGVWTVAAPARVRGDRASTPPPSGFHRNAAGRIELPHPARVHLRGQGRKDAHDHEPAGLSHRRTPRRARARRPQCPRPLGQAHPAERDRRSARSDVVTTTESEQRIAGAYQLMCKRRRPGSLVRGGWSWSGAFDDELGAAVVWRSRSCDPPRVAEIVVTWIVATAVLPFVIGWALGHAGYAAAVFVALGISSLLLSLTSGVAGVMQGLGVSFLLSSAPAYFGGRVRASGYGPRWLGHSAASAAAWPRRDPPGSSR